MIDATEEEIIALVKADVNLYHLPTQMDDPIAGLYKVYEGVRYHIDTFTDMLAKGLIPNLKVWAPKE